MQRPQLLPFARRRAVELAFGLSMDEQLERELERLSQDGEHEHGPVLGDDPDDLALAGGIAVHYKRGSAAFGGKRPLSVASLLETEKEATGGVAGAISLSISL